MGDDSLNIAVSDSSPLLSKESFLESRITLSSKKKPKLATPSSSFFCGHCNQSLTRTTFKRHEILYKRADQSWITKEMLMDSECIDDSEENTGLCRMGLQAKFVILLKLGCAVHMYSHLVVVLSAYPDLDHHSDIILWRYKMAFN